MIPVLIKFILKMKIYFIDPTGKVNILFHLCPMITKSLQLCFTLAKEQLSCQVKLKQIFRIHFSVGDYTKALLFFHQLIQITKCRFKNMPCFPFLLLWNKHSVKKPNKLTIFPQNRQIRCLLTPFIITSLLFVEQNK